mgnify:CR=1 FL=1
MFKIFQWRDAEKIQNFGLFQFAQNQALLKLIFEKKPRSAQKKRITENNFAEKRWRKRVQETEEQIYVNEMQIQKIYTHIYECEL